MVAIANISHFVAPSGKLLVIARGREASDPTGEIPYLLTKSELQQLEHHGLRCSSFEDYLDNETPPVRRFRALYLNSDAILRVKGWLNKSLTPTSQTLSPE